MRRLVAALALLGATAGAEELRVEDLTAFDTERIDELYAGLTAGVMPDGDYAATVLEGEVDGRRVLADLAFKLGIPVGAEALRRLGVELWSGRSFQKADGIARMTTAAWGTKFPARMYCGQSFADPKRESIVVDWSRSEGLPGYDARVDWLPGRTGLALRDELRQLRPGVYLGRAFMGRRLVLSFVLQRQGKEPAAVATPRLEECWTGVDQR
jgi:hypothetical protein